MSTSGFLQGSSAQSPPKQHQRWPSGHRWVDESSYSRTSSREVGLGRGGVGNDLTVAIVHLHRKLTCRLIHARRGLPFIRDLCLDRFGRCVFRDAFCRHSRCGLARPTNYTGASHALCSMMWIDTSALCPSSSTQYPAKITPCSTREFSSKSASE
jgi:hypothetical protein